MAKIQCMITYLTLLTCQILCGEGRHIRHLNREKINHIKSPSHRGIRKLSTPTDKSYHSKNSVNPKKISPAYSETITHKQKSPALILNHKSRKSNSFWVDFSQSNCLGEHCPEGYKPTAPGKSPGAGHAFVTSMDNVSPNQPTQSPDKMWNNLEASADDFRETKPGQSPGAGHAKGGRRDSNLTPAQVQEDYPPTPISFFSDSELISTNDFKPTAPGGSPGAGHPETNKSDVNCPSVKCRNDNRPTTPGDYPGAGHPNTSNSDSTTSEQDLQSGETYPQGGLDDYRPTRPGQSPGAGHAVLNKQEPNP